MISRSGSVIHHRCESDRRWWHERLTQRWHLHTEGTVILEFPSIEAAKGWYDGSPCREARAHRFKGATYRVTLVKGVRSQPFTGSQLGRIY